MSAKIEADTPLFTTKKWGETQPGVATVGQVRQYILAYLLEEAYRYGQMYVVDGNIPQAGLGTTPQKIQGFQQAGAFGGLTVDVGNDQFIVQRTGDYTIGYSLHFDGGNNATYRFGVAINGVVTPLLAPQVIATADGLGSGGSTGIIRVAEGDAVALFATADQTNRTLELIHANMWMSLMGSEEWAVDPARLGGAFDLGFSEGFQ